MASRHLRNLLSWNSWRAIPGRLNLYSVYRLTCATTAFVAVLIFCDWLRLDSDLPMLSAGSSQRILDRYGQEIRHALSINGERRYLVPLDTIPQQLRDAFVEAEDRRFYTHKGVDWRALARGLYQTVQQRRKVSGGSTITMQLVKVHWPQTRGIVHKPAQILQALWLEQKYSKGEILDQYLNTVPFGNQVSGVGAACRYFFNKTCEQLSAGQMATLAILPRNPSLYGNNPAALMQRRSKLLQRIMTDTDSLILSQAQSEPIEFTKTNSEFFAPHLTERILDESHQQPEIHTSIDLELQKNIQRLLYAETEKGRGSGDSGAVLVLANDTGEVLAYVGSPDYFGENHGMVDGVRVLRSPGSALKPFVYELALENNWNLFNLVPDIPMVFSTQRAVYEPNNYGGNFSGPRSLRDALGNSKNLPALYLTSQLGEARVLGHLKRMGFTSLNKDAAYYGVGMALGNGEVSLWQLTQAYSTLARLGLAITPSYYRTAEVQARRVIPEETAYLIADVLRDPQARQEEFGRFGPMEFDYNVAVKTGTSSDYRDNWIVGFTKKITVGVWRGNANSAPMAQRLSASRGTGPLFHKIMARIHRYRNPSWPTRPEGLQTSRVCSLSGQLPGKFCTSTREEYHLKGQAPVHTCAVHKSITVPNCNGRKVSLTYVQLPKEYDEWTRSSRIPSLENQLQEKCGQLATQLNYAATGKLPPVIVEPLDRTTYAIDPTMPREHQEVRFLLRNADAREKSRMYINDKPVNYLTDENEMFWPLQRGQFKFYVKSGDVVSNEVNILVR